MQNNTCLSFVLRMMEIHRKYLSYEISKKATAGVQEKYDGDLDCEKVIQRVSRK